MVKPQPVNLNLLTMRFPVTAIVSILHRISGVFIFLLIPAVLACLHCSLTSALAYDGIHTWLSHPVLKMLVWLGYTAVIYHVLAGIRHLLMDIDIGETLAGGRRGAWLVLILSLIGFVWMGVYLWR